MNPEELSHAIRIVQLENACASLLREASQSQASNDQPDNLLVRFYGHTLEVEYMRGHISIGGESS